MHIKCRRVQIQPSRDLWRYESANEAKKNNFLQMTLDAIEAMTETELKEALIGRGVDVSGYQDKTELVNKALSL